MILFSSENTLLIYNITVFGLKDISIIDSVQYTKCTVFILAILLIGYSKSILRENHVKNNMLVVYKIKIQKIKILKKISLKKSVW